MVRQNFNKIVQSLKLYEQKQVELEQEIKLLREGNAELVEKYKAAVLNI